MIALAIDTSTAGSSLAIALNGRDLASITVLDVRHHSQSIFEHLQMLLKLASLELEQVDVFAAVRGPGSFTGLRIGLAAIEGISLTLARPAVGVTAFDAHAGTLGVAGHVAVLIDAGRGEVFCGLRALDETGEPVLVGHDFVGSIARVLCEVSSCIPDAGKRVYFVGNGAARYADEICRLAEEAGHAVTVSEVVDHGTGGWWLLPQAHSLSAWVAKSATRMVAEGRSPGLHPYYLKPSDAERKWTNLNNQL